VRDGLGQHESQEKRYLRHGFGASHGERLPGTGRWGIIPTIKYFGWEEMTIPFVHGYAAKRKSWIGGGL
jgi:hypothetical protein